MNPIPTLFSPNVYKCISNIANTWFSNKGEKITDKNKNVMKFYRATATASDCAVEPWQQTAGASTWSGLHGLKHLSVVQKHGFVSL